MVTVMLLAAGYGTRLRPLTDRVPKPLVPVGDRPAIAHVIQNLRRQLGAFDLVVNAHHRAALLKSFVQEHAPEAQVLVETTILGTAGGVRAAWSSFRSAPVLVVNADILACPDYARLLAVAGIGTCCLCVTARNRGDGSVGVDADGRIVRLRGEVFGKEVAGADYMGTAVLGPDAIDTLPACGCLVGDWLLPLLRRGVEVRAHEQTVVWDDIGDVQSYARANWDWLGLRGLKSWVASSANVSAGAELRSAVVGAGASVETQGTLERVIVWPGARVDRPLSDAVVMDNGDIVPLPNVPS
jgi:mannose-1-phosphate guanylyltransferase